MQISSRNFIASQALYGLLISHPRWKTERCIVEAYKIASAMMKQSKKKRKKDISHSDISDRI